MKLTKKTAWDKKDLEELINIITEVSDCTWTIRDALNNAQCDIEEMEEDNHDCNCKTANLNFARIESRLQLIEFWTNSFRTTLKGE